MTYKAFEVVVVPFPFTDRQTTKRRPALVLSDLKAFGTSAAHSVLAMITSANNAEWPLDISVQDLDPAGLPSPSVVRMKLFTLDHRLIVRRAGVLSGRDQKSVRGALRKLLPLK